jgi:hypothetical protein
MGITGIVGPGLFTLTFSNAIRTWKVWFLVGAPFLLASALLSLGVVLALGVRPAVKTVAPNGDYRALTRNR